MVWDEGKQEEEPTLLNTSPALLETTRGLASGPVLVPRSTAAPRTPPPTPSPLPLGSSAAPAADPLTDSFFDLLDNPHVGHNVRTIHPEDAPADLQEKTVIYPAVEELRRIVGKVDNEADSRRDRLARRAVHPLPLRPIPRSDYGVSG